MINSWVINDDSCLFYQDFFAILDIQTLCGLADALTAQAVNLAIASLLGGSSLNACCLVETKGDVLIKQTKKPKWNLLAMTDVDTVTDDKAVFNSFYLFETFILTSYFEKPSAIHYQILLWKNKYLDSFLLLRVKN